MTIAMTSPEVTTRTVGRMTWTTVDRGFSVASRDGEYVGCIDEVAGAYVVRDSRNTPVGRYPTIDDARHALRDALETAQIDPEREEPWRRVAAVTAVVAGGALLTAGVLAPWL